MCLDRLRNQCRRLRTSTLPAVKSIYTSAYEKDEIIIFILFSLFYFYWYLKDPAVPANDISKYLGWWGWWDQGQYYKTALDLGHGVISPSSYWYGYPLLAAPFVSILPGHPFFFPNYLLGLLVTRYFYLISARLTTKIEAASLTVLLILASERMMLKCLIWPWNSIPCYVAALAISYYLVFERITRRGIIICSLMLALVVMCRPQDVPWLTALFFASLVLDEAKRHLVFAVAVFTICLCLALGALGCLNFLGYNQLIPPYVQTAATVGFSLEDIGYRLYQLLVDGAVLHRLGALPPGVETPTLLREAPLMLLSLGGVVMAAGNDRRPYALFCICVAVIIYYVAFNASSNPPHFWTYNLFHYFWWVVVMFSLFGYCYLRALLFDRSCISAHVLTAISLLIFFGSGYKESLVMQGFLRGGESMGIKIDSQYSAATQTQKVDIVSNMNLLDGLRILSKGGTPFHFTSAGYFERVKIFSDDRQLQYWRDYMFSQDGDVINIHFVHPNNVRHLELEIATEKPILVEGISYLRASYAPFLTLKRFLQYLRGDTAYPLRQIYLPTPYRWGEELSFNAGGNGINYLGYGWSHPEQTHIWSVAREASVFLGFVPPRPSKAILVIKLAAYVDTQVSVKLNGQVIGKRIKLTPRENVIRLPIEIFDQEVAEISLVAGGLIKPIEVDINSTDQRSLGVALFSVRLENE